MRVARIATARGERHAIEQPGANGTAEWAVIEDPFAPEILYTGERVRVAGTDLLTPVQPTVIVGIAHNKTINDHRLPIQAWHKSARSLAGPGDDVPLRAGIGSINIEGELALVIGKPAYRLTLENALEVVFGYTIANDITNVEQVGIDEKFFQVKSGVNYAPVGPWIETGIADPDDVAITVSINGQIRAESGTGNLPSSIAECLVYVTSWLELGPGDLVFTGAPGTLLPVRPGDVIDIALAGIGTLSNTASREASYD